MEQHCMPEWYVRRKKPLVKSVSASMLACLMVAPALCHAQNNVSVTIDLTKPGNFLAPRALGVQASIYDPDMLKPETVAMLREAGILTLRYPGGRASDGNHWSVFNGYDGRHPVDFGSFVRVVDQLGGTMVLAVNYGSNLADNGPGEPAEAAAWVAYANGMPEDGKVIGADSTGRDWKTVGYWATMRSSAPLEHDDGYNFLRIGHPRQLNVKYWEVGNEVFANGFDAKDAGGAETDRHAPSDPDKGRNTALRAKNPKLSPVAYGQGVAAFAKAMKAVDNRISIGASLKMPTATDTWNGAVLKSCAADVDFIVLHWYSQPLLPPDYKQLDSVSLLAEPASDLPEYVGQVLDLLKTAAPGRAVQLSVTELGIPSWVQVTAPVALGLFAADAYASLAEDGAVTVDWAELHSPYFLLAKDNSPQPVYFGVQMLHKAVNMRDVFVSSKSSSSLLAVHAAKRSDGSLGMIFINKDPSSAATVKVKVGGANLEASGTRYDWGLKTPADGTKVRQSRADSLGSVFTVSVPPYAITDLVVPIAK